MTPMLKRILIVFGIGVVVLLVVGFINGAIGAAFLGRDAGFLPAPHVELAPPEVFKLGGLSVTNAMLSSWVTTVVLILFFVVGTRRKAMVPKGLQNVAEWAIESLYNFVESGVGQRYGRSFFPIIATIFLFVSFNAWLALIPIYQSLWVSPDGVNKVHLLRSAGTDLNMPLAIALVSAVFVEYWGLRVHKIGYLREFVRFGTLYRGLRRFSLPEIFSGLIDIFVGFLELISHFVRIVSFTFRLFGNMTAGEIVLLISAFLISFVFTLPFYGLELLVGFIQALIFAGLTLAFVMVAVASHGDEAH